MRFRPEVLLLSTGLCRWLKQQIRHAWSRTSKKHQQTGPSPFIGNLIWVSSCSISQLVAPMQPRKLLTALSVNRLVCPCPCKFLGLFRGTRSLESRWTPGRSALMNESGLLKGQSQRGRSFSWNCVVITCVAVSRAATLVKNGG